MEVRREPFDDHSEPDADGMYDWRYAGVTFHFADGADAVAFRRYDDDPGVATLVAPAGWRPEVYSGALFQAAIAFLRDREGVRVIHVSDPESGTFAPLAAATAAARRLGLPAHGVPDLEAAT